VDLGQPSDFWVSLIEQLEGGEDGREELLEAKYFSVPDHPKYQIWGT
jgi:hypothetical protein